jgi:hypothetical protein
LTPVDSFFLPPDTDCRLPRDGTRKRHANFRNTRLSLYQYF